MSLLPQYKDLISEYLLNGTLHGWAFLLRAKRLFQKSVWLIAILLSVGYCFYSIIVTLQAYYDHQVVTEIVFKSELPKEFPAVR